MRLDSIGYRLLWNARRIFRVLNPGPRPVLWRDPKHFQPTAQWRETLSPMKRKKLDFVLDELHLLSRIYTYMPLHITNEQFAQLLEFSSRRERFHFINFLCQKERRHQTDNNAKCRRRKAVDTSITESSSDGERQNVIQSTSLFFAISAFRQRHIRQTEQIRFAQAMCMPETPRLIVDCRYLPDHSLRGLNLTLLQLAQLVSHNRQRVHPWPLYFANFALERVRLKKKNNQSNMELFEEGNESCVEISSKSYLEMFPEAATAQKVVYLSPHADRVLERVDDDIFYIIGGIVDRVAEPLINKQASLVTAEAEGLPCFRLPLDEHLAWKSGNKLLTITGVARILQEVYVSGGSDWKPVLERLIPARKLRDHSEKNPFIMQKYKNIHLHRNGILQILDEMLPCTEELQNDMADASTRLKADE